MNNKPHYRSKTQQALRLVDKGLTPYAAAKKIGINPSNVYRAIQARVRRNDDLIGGSA